MALSGVQSIKTSFRKSATRWSLISVGLFFPLALLASIYTSRLSAERYAKMLASSASLAYRPMILSGDTRGAQFQLEKAFNLKPEEEVIVFDDEKKPIFKIP